MATRTLSDLEGVVLGLIWASPSTPYQVRRVIQESPNPSWSGSAGAIYPLFERLRKRGLLRAKQVRQGERYGTEYAVTAAGTLALQLWIEPPLAPTVVGVPPDPLRSRLYFLAALPPARQKAFLQEAISGLRAHVRAIEGDCRRKRTGGNVFSYLTARGALHTCRARLMWLREAQAVIPVRAEWNGAHEPHRKETLASGFNEREYH